MILKNLKIFKNGNLKKVNILIQEGLIKEILFNNAELDRLIDDNRKSEIKEKELQIIDCRGKIGIPGIIDIHAHMRDLNQSDKETFITSSKAAAYSGITTVFNMPNTKPPANSASQVKKWMEKAKGNLHVDVCFIAAIPESINKNEIKKIIDLGVIGFKIYPHSPLSEIDWLNPNNFENILEISSSHNIHIFIHPDLPMSKDKKNKVDKDYITNGYNILKYHHKLHPPISEQHFVKYALENYESFIENKNIHQSNYPSIHFCHISCKKSYITLRGFKSKFPHFKVSFEVTPHHLLLSNDINLKNYNFGKVLPPLRNIKSRDFLYEQLKRKNIELIGTDHAPHTLDEKDQPFNDAPSGFPGFETYPLTLLNKVCQYELSLEHFINVSSKNPSLRFNLNKKGFIKKGYQANIVIIDKITKYKINSQNFKTKAKFSPFDGYETSVEIWKVFLRGKQINTEDSSYNGKIELLR